MQVLPAPFLLKLDMSRRWSNGKTPCTNGETEVRTLCGGLFSEKIVMQQENQTESTAISQAEMDACLEVLQRVSEDPTVVDDHERFKGLVAKIHRLGKRGQRDRKRKALQAATRTAVESTGIVRQQNGTDRQRIASADNPVATKLLKARPCYVCKSPYSELHHFYHLLCPECASFNWNKRTQRSDLCGRVALVTGGRIKIGFHVALKLLRDGAEVIVTTRFVADAAERFQQEDDFETWKDRLQIYALDLRSVPSVECFAAQLLKSLPALDILIHNAAQTVKRPLEFYRHLLEKPAVANAAGLIRSGEKPVLLEASESYGGQIHGVADYFPLQKFDVDGQQLDLRPLHSWMLKLGEVGTIEMLEVMLVNAAAPFTLTGLLKPLMLRSAHQRRFVVNVSAMEGQFARKNKTAFHPHTNMAKAALNMLTRTSAEDFASQGIYMNSVDTGWITDEKPAPIAQRVREDHGFYPPLDIVDGAARIYDPIATGCNLDDEPLFGHFLKDYFPHPW